jgi:putative transposase
MLLLRLRRESIKIGRRHVGTLMKRVGIEALYRKPSTSREHAAHSI